MGSVSKGLAYRLDLELESGILVAERVLLQHSLSLGDLGTLCLENTLYFVAVDNTSDIGLSNDVPRQDIIALGL